MLVWKSPKKSTTFIQGMDKPNPTPLPDPWLFDSEALLRELDRCRETVLQIPITNPNATHFGIQLAVNAIYTLTENLRYLLHLHRDGQRAIRKQHDDSLQHALQNPTKTQERPLHRKVVRMPAGSSHTREPARKAASNARA
jgi:hypothetical protein